MSESLTREGLFTLVCDHVFGDGVVSPTENKTLQQLVKFLQLDRTKALEIATAAAGRFQEGKLRDGGPLAPLPVLEAAIVTALGEGEVKDEEGGLLIGLAEILQVEEVQVAELFSRHGLLLGGTSGEFEHLFAESVLDSSDKNQLLEKLINARKFDVDLSLGVVRVGKETWPIRPLGVVDAKTNTWQWAWENAGRGEWNADSLKAVNEIKATGRESGCRELILPQLAVEDVDPMRVCMVCCKLAGADGVLVWPYAGGSLYVLVINDELRAAREFEASRVIRVINSAIAAWEFHHRSAFEAYMLTFGYECREVGGTVCVVDGSENSMGVQASFDELGRFNSLEASSEES